MNQEYSQQEREQLLLVAREAIENGLLKHQELKLDLSRYSDHLLENRACFVTIEFNGELRGCIGSLEAYQPLIQDVAKNAFMAAFSDPRSAPLSLNEWRNELSIHISVLNEPKPVVVMSEEELLKKIHPGIDGLILIEGANRATFLPSVWETLPDPVQFLNHLKMKAGYSADYWSNNMKFMTYQSELIE